MTDETITVGGKTLYRIKALTDNPAIFVFAGDLGGFVEKTGNLSMSGNAQVSGDALVSGNADYIVFKNWWSSSRFFTWTRSNDMWRVGCFFGTGKELIAKAYKDSKVSGREYERVVRYVDEILNEK